MCFLPCNGCGFWRIVANVDVQDGVALGRCHRKAPMTFYDPDHRKVKTRWPMTRADAGCGQHEPIVESSVWLIERRTIPPQWNVDVSPTGIGSFYSDIHRAHKYPTWEDARRAMTRLSITDAERGQFFVSEHLFSAVIDAASPNAERSAQ